MIYWMSGSHPDIGLSQGSNCVSRCTQTALGKVRNALSDSNSGDQQEKPAAENGEVTQKITSLIYYIYTMFQNVHT